MAGSVRSIERQREKGKAKTGVIEVTIGDLFDSAAALQVLINTRLDGMVRFRLRRIVDQVKPALESFDTTRKELAEQHGELTEDKANWTFPDPEKAKAFWETLKEVRAHPEKIQGQKFTRVEFANAQISLAEEESLSWLFTE